VKTITLFTRHACHLCDEARSVLERVRAEHPFALSIVDLDRDAPPDKRAAYDWEVPVVEIDGRKAFKYRIAEARLVRLLLD